MSDIKIHVFHTGTVCVAPNLPFGGENCSAIKASGLFGKRSDRIWLPVSAYLIECEHGKVLFDCDHANGMKLVANAKQILVSRDELDFANKKTPVNIIRYNSAWWDETKMETFDWNGVEGPAGKSYDVFGDGSLVMVNIPGHSDGLCALKITNQAGKYVLLFADGGYATKSWKEQITSGIAADKVAQKKSLVWIREQSISPECVESLANHDTEIEPHVINL